LTNGREPGVRIHWVLSGNAHTEVEDGEQGKANQGGTGSQPAGIAVAIDRRRKRNQQPAAKPAATIAPRRGKKGVIMARDNAALFCDRSLP
jgi:hypothetical protein